MLETSTFYINPNILTYFHATQSAAASAGNQFATYHSGKILAVTPPPQNQNFGENPAKLIDNDPRLIALLDS